MQEVSSLIKDMDEKIRDLDEKLSQILLTIPNIPHTTVPEGKDSEDNVEVRRWGEPREFSFEAKPHWDIGDELGILDFATAAKVTGARFTFIRARC